MNTLILTMGERYNLEELRPCFAGWTDDDTAAYQLDYYFSENGVYLGPDADGVEPLFFAETQ